MAKAGAIMEAFQRGTYRFGLQKKVTLRDGETVALWSSADALVIKVTRIIRARLQPFLSQACYHLVRLWILVVKMEAKARVCLLMLDKVWRVLARALCNGSLSSTGKGTQVFFPTTSANSLLVKG